MNFRRCDVMSRRDPARTAADVPAAASGAVSAIRKVSDPTARPLLGEAVANVKLRGGCGRDLENGYISRMLSG